MVKTIIRLMALCILVLSTHTVAASEYSKAKYKGKINLSKIGCAKGDIWDPRNGGECWSCKGKQRDVLQPIDSPKACFQPAESKFSSAKKHKSHVTFCASGQIQANGACWTCPSGYKHDAGQPITSSKVCYKKHKKTDKKMSKTSASHCGIGKPGISHKGHCYACSSGYKHDIGKSFNKSGICYKPEYYSHHKASKRSTLAGLKCPSGQAYDPAGGGSCWSCPSGYTQTANAITGKKACTKKVNKSVAKASFKRASKVASQGCESGNFPDAHNGGECWTCPKSHPQRTLYEVTSKKACASKTCGLEGGRPCMVWERVPSCNKGLIEDPFTNTCAQPKNFACETTIKAIREIKKINRELAEKGREAQEKAINSIHGAKELIMYAKNQKQGMEDNVKKLTDKIDASMATDELTKVLKQAPDEIGRFLTTVIDTVDKAHQVEEILLDPKLVCAGNAKRAVQKIRKLGLFDQYVQKGPSIWQLLNPISSAYAANKVVYQNNIDFSMAVDLPINYTFGGKVTVTPGIGVTLSINPNDGTGEWSFDFGVGAAEAEDNVFGGNLGTVAAPLGAMLSVGWSHGRDVGPDNAVSYPGLGLGLLDGLVEVCFDPVTPFLKGGVAGDLFCGLSVPIAGGSTDVYTQIIPGGLYFTRPESDGLFPKLKGVVDDPKAAKKDLGKKIKETLLSVSLGIGSSVDL